MPLKEAVEEFKKKHPKSAKLYDKAVDLLPGGVCHNIRLWGMTTVGAYPIYVEGAKGSHIFDVDGNEYVDYWLGHGSMIHGHTPKPVVEALERQIKEIGGMQWGIVNPYTLELAELVREFVPEVEMIRFCNTGTEATMYAVRLMRGYTGKKTIIKQIGGWHGFNDTLNWYVHGDTPYESIGMIDEIKDYVKVVPFGDAEKTLEVIKENKDDLAGVIFAIGMSREEGVAEYLKAVKEALVEVGAPFCIDEVYSGFALGPAGAHGYFGVSPDLLAFGKILGGGLPLGATGGRRDIMELADPRLTGEKKYSDIVGIGGGTFSQNPMTMLAGIVALKMIKDDKDFYPKLFKEAKAYRDGLREIFMEEGVKLGIVGYANRFSAETSPLGRESSQEWCVRLQNKGIYGHRPGGMTCAAHTTEDRKHFLDATREIIHEMRDEIKAAKLLG